uniref:zinc finger protein 175 isoform X5 n=1 Tax=Jaculus jaculus TaxID=51337 RepID=UPI001E1B4A75|nr:zinc finger protein 175 isoform X5 [Jaculus jaculus]
MPAGMTLSQKSQRLGAEKPHESCERLVSFEDVSVDFTWEEWQHLDLAQRCLYQDVMLEIYSHLLSVGHPNLSPEVLFRMEKGKEAQKWEAEFLHKRFQCQGIASEGLPCQHLFLILGNPSLMQHINKFL